MRKLKNSEFLVMVIAFVLGLVSFVYAGESALSMHGDYMITPALGPADVDVAVIVPDPATESISFEVVGKEILRITPDGKAIWNGGDDHMALWEAINNSYPQFLKRHCGEQKPVTDPDPTADRILIVPDPLQLDFSTGTTRLCSCDEAEKTNDTITLSGASAYTRSDTVGKSLPPCEKPNDGSVWRVWGDYWICNGSTRRWDSGIWGERSQ